MKISVDEKTWHDPRFVQVCKLLHWEEQTVLGALVMLKCRIYGNNVELARQPIEVLTGLGKHAGKFIDALLAVGLLFETPSGAFILDGAQRALMLRQSRVEAGRRGGLKKRPSKPEPVKAKPARKKKDLTTFQIDCAAAWGAYASAYMNRWKSPPVRNEKVNRHVQDLVKRVGKEAPTLLRWFVLKHNDDYYVRRTHQIQDCLKDAESLVTQMRADQPITKRDVSAAARHQTVQAQLAGVRSGELLR